MKFTVGGSSFTSNLDDIAALKAAFGIYVLMTKPSDETPGQLVESLLSSSQPNVHRLGRELAKFFMTIQDSE